MTWIQYIPFKRDVRALKHLIEIELGSEIVDINYSVRARLMGFESSVVSERCTKQQGYVVVVCHGKNLVKN